MTTKSEGREKGLLERFLSLFAEVRGGEAVVVLLLTLDVFLLLTAYYLLKVAREPLVLLGGAFGLKGATLKAAAAAVQAVLLLGIVPAYAFLADKVNRVKLITIVTTIFVGCLVAFNLAANMKLPIGFIFFIWLGIFNLMIVAQFWSFANDVYTEEQGKRLFAIVAFGGTAGAIVGAWLGGTLAEAIGPFQVMLVSAGMLAACVVLTQVVHRLEDRNASASRDKKDKPLSGAGGFGLVLKNRYLLLIGLMILIYNTVNTNGEFILGEIVTDQATATAEREVAAGLAGDERANAIKDHAGKIIGGFYGDFFTYVNLLTAFIQLFLVSRIFKWFGVRAALFFLPVIALAGYTTIALVPALMIVKVSKILENSTDYSVQNTTRQALFLPTNREEKYKAKAAIDTFFVRFGDMASFGVVLAATVWLGLGGKGVAAVNIALVAIWLALAVGIARHHKKLSPDSRAGVEKLAK
jgi:ATP:ADP antiporter, AAA family